MKIFVPFEVKDIGGTSTFAAKFKAGLEKAGHTVTFEMCSDYDLLFLIVQCPLKHVFHAKQHRKPIVQRLDGVYYWSLAGWRFMINNMQSSLIRHLFTNFTVYQSNFSQLAVKQFLGPKLFEKSAVIYNGVDLSVFQPTGLKKPALRDNSKQQLFLAASLFRHRGQIVPLIEAIDYYAKHYNDNCKLLVAGSFTGKASDIPNLYHNHPRAVFLGKVNNKDLPVYARSADVFVCTDFKPAGPNNITEALACGIPVCTLAEGAAPEIVERGKTGLLTPTNNSFWRSRTFNLDQFCRHMHQLTQERKKYSAQARISAEKRFSLDQMTQEYSRILLELIT